MRTQLAPLPFQSAQKPSSLATSVNVCQMPWYLAGCQCQDTNKHKTAFALCGLADLHALDLIKTAQDHFERCRLQAPAAHILIRSSGAITVLFRTLRSHPNRST